MAAKDSLNLEINMIVLPVKLAPLLTSTDFIYPIVINKVDTIEIIKERLNFFLLEKIIFIKQQIKKPKSTPPKFAPLKKIKYIRIKTKNQTKSHHLLVFKQILLKNIMNNTKNNVPITNSVVININGG